MTLSVARIAKRIRDSLGGMPESPIAAIVNDCGEFLVSIQSWGWLARQELVLDLKKGQPFARLPLNFPREIRNVLSWQAASSLTRDFELVTLQELIDLRTAGTLPGSSMRGSIVHLEPKHSNLLRRTESLHEGTASGPVWFTSATITPTLASGASDPLHPLSGERGVAKLTANGGGNLFQDVPAHLLKDGAVYWASGFLRPDGVAPPTRTTVQLIVPGAGGLLRTCADITWAGTPTITQRVATPISAGAGLHTLFLKRYQDNWVRWGCALTRDMVIESGIVRIVITPVAPDLGESNKIVFATGAQIELVEPYVPGAMLPDGPLAYVPTIADEYPAGSAPAPVLALWPVPEADEPNAIHLTYAAGFPYVDNDTDAVAIPDYLNGYFLELCAEWAHGLEEGDREPLSVRIARRMGPGNPLLEGAATRDLDMQPSLGTLRNGYIESGYHFRDWDSGTAVAGPEAS